MAKKKKGAGGSGRKFKPKPEFRSQVEDEIVDQLLYRFVALVQKGLELMLDAPSDLTRTEFRQNPALAYTAEDIPALALWAATMAYELPWPEFRQHILTHPARMTLLGVETKADLDSLLPDLGNYAVRLLELAVHDALKEGDKQEQRPAGQKPKVQDEFAEFIGASRVLKMLKKRLRPLLKQLDRQDPSRPRHRPRTYRTRSFVPADLLRWMLGLQSTAELIRKLKQHPNLAGAAREASSTISTGGGRLWNAASSLPLSPCWAWPGSRSKPDIPIRSALPAPGLVAIRASAQQLHIFAVPVSRQLHRVRYACLLIRSVSTFPDQTGIIICFSG